MSDEKKKETKTERVTPDQVPPPVSRKVINVNRRGSPDLPATGGGRQVLGGVRSVAGQSLPPGVAAPARARGPIGTPEVVAHNHGYMEKVRSKIAAKAHEVICERASLAKEKKADAHVVECDIGTCYAITCEAFPDAVLSLHLLEWVRDHKGRAAEPVAFLEQTAKVVAFLASV